MKRVLVIGPCGAGKSTLSVDLGQRLDLPVHHLDRLHWSPGWVEGDKNELIEQVAAITAGDRWLIDGNYGSTMAERLARADTVVYLDFPIHLCFWRALKRIWTWRGRSRPDMTEGCPERFDLEFLTYILRWNQGPKPRTEAILKGFQGDLVRLKSPRALDDWLANLPRRDRSDLALSGL
ncbi:MAG: topology modulation protein [Sphingomonadales bacterium]|nr:topology modulation protein [Sphingomonadales bacterium]